MATEHRSGKLKEAEIEMTKEAIAQLDKWLDTKPVLMLQLKLKEKARLVTLLEELEAGK